MDDEKTTGGVSVTTVPLKASPTDDLVEAWLMQWFFNLGLPTELQNRLRNAADDLKARLAGQKE